MENKCLRTRTCSHIILQIQFKDFKLHALNKLHAQEGEKRNRRGIKWRRTLAMKRKEQGRQQSRLLATIFIWNPNHMTLASTEQEREREKAPGMLPTRFRFFFLLQICVQCIDFIYEVWYSCCDFFSAIFATKQSKYAV